MRITDNRYAGERDRFDLAMRMIGHEARTGTIRACTGFTEDRIRKIYTHYFLPLGDRAARRHRGKSPTQIAPFVSSARRQSEATLLACLFVYCQLARLDAEASGLMPVPGLQPLTLGQRLCDAFEIYRAIQPDPGLSFEWAWNLHQSLVHTRELRIAWCADCLGPYVRDAFALDYQHCPMCELKDLAVAG